MYKGKDNLLYHSPPHHVMEGSETSQDNAVYGLYRHLTAQQTLHGVITTENAPEVLLIYTDITDRV